MLNTEIEKKEILELNTKDVGVDLTNKFIYGFSVIGFLTFSGFSILYKVNENESSFRFYLILSIATFVNLLIFKLFHKVTLAKSLILIIMLLAYMFILARGGFGGNTGLVWFSAFPVMTFFLFGTRKGLIPLGVLYGLGLMSMYLGDNIYAEVAFTPTEIRQMLLSLTVVSSLIFFYQMNNEAKQKVIDAGKEERLKRVKDLQKEVEERMESQETLSKNVEEINKQNVLLVDTKKAMVNILADLEKEKEKVLLEKDRINTILYSIGDAVFAVDRDYKIIIYNDICENLTGYSTEEALGKRYNEIFKFVFEDKEDDENNQFIIDSLEKGLKTEMSNHTLLITKNGKKIPVSDSSSPVKDKNDEVVGCVVVFRDVSKEREVDRAKTEFVSLASHQLRTPLSAINWYVELLLGGDAGELSEQQKEFLSEISQGNKRMVDLVDSLLNVSRIDLGTFAIDPVPTNIVEIADSVVKEMTPLIESKKLIIDKNYAEISEMNVDPKLTRIIFQNLISNAIKYTPTEGKVNIELTKDDKNVLLKVSDTGYGIPKNQQDKIFNKLFRADNVIGKDVDGTGLGLYIVKSILDNGGGRIWFESEENKGTTFYVEIPLEGMKSKAGVKELS